MEGAEPVPFLVRLARDAAWAPVSVLILHEVAARSFGHEPYVDPVMHVLGGMAAAFFLRYASSIAGRWLGAPSATALNLLAFGLTCAVALAWELAEFASDQYLGTRAQRDLGNSMRDLVLGVSGAIAYLAIRRLLRGPRG